MGRIFLKQSLNVVPRLYVIFALLALIGCDGDGGGSGNNPPGPSPSVPVISSVQLGQPITSSDGEGAVDGPVFSSNFGEISITMDSEDPTGYMSVWMQVNASVVPVSHYDWEIVRWGNQVPYGTISYYDEVIDIDPSLGIYKVRSVGNRVRYDSVDNSLLAENHAELIKVTAWSENGHFASAYFLLSLIPESPEVLNILLLGQSNAHGAPGTFVEITMPDGLRTGEDPRLSKTWLTWYGKPEDGNNYHLHHLKPWAYPDPNIWGPELFGGWSLANNYYHTVITKATIGGVPIDTFMPGNSGWNLMVSNYGITEAERVAEGIPDLGPIDVLWWGQGEQLSVPAGNYYNDLTNLIAQIKAEFNSPNMKVVFIGLNHRYDESHESDVAFRTYVEANPDDAIYVNTKDLHVRGDSGLEPLNVHYSAQGLKDLGYAMAEATRAVLSGGSNSVTRYPINGEGLPYSTFASAYADASAGDTILLSSGTFDIGDTTFGFNKSVNILGSGSESTTLKANGFRWLTTATNCALQGVGFTQDYNDVDDMFFFNTFETNVLDIVWDDVFIHQAGLGPHCLEVSGAGICLTNVRTFAENSHAFVLKGCSNIVVRNCEATLGPDCSGYGLYLKSHPTQKGFLRDFLIDGFKANGSLLAHVGMSNCLMENGQLYNLELIAPDMSYALHFGAAESGLTNNYINNIVLDGAYVEGQYALVFAWMEGCTNVTLRNIIAKTTLGIGGVSSAVEKNSENLVFENIEIITVP